jgi:hypothetical protein
MTQPDQDPHGTGPAEQIERIKESLPPEKVDHIETNLVLSRRRREGVGLPYPAEENDLIYWLLCSGRDLPKPERGERYDLRGYVFSGLNPLKNEEIRQGLKPELLDLGLDRKDLREPKLLLDIRDLGFCQLNHAYFERTLIAGTRNHHGGAYFTFFRNVILRDSVVIAHVHRIFPTSFLLEDASIFLGDEATGTISFPYGHGKIVNLADKSFNLGCLHNMSPFIDLIGDFNRTNYDTPD